jgi:hypothetical protein
MNPDSFKKGIQVGAGGILRLFGAKGVPLYDQNGVRKPESGVSWTHLSKPGGPKFDPNFALFTPDTKQYFTEISPVTSKPTGVKAPVSAADIGANSQTLHLEDDVTQGGTTPGRLAIGSLLPLPALLLSSRNSSRSLMSKKRRRGLEALLSSRMD